MAVQGIDDEIHLMNEVALHRGASPHLTIIDAFVNGQHLTEAIVSLECGRLLLECTLMHDFSATSDS